MKHLSLILNAVLLIAVGILYYLHFEPSAGGNGGSAHSASVSDFKIAFVNADTLLEKYEYIKASAEIMEAKNKRLRATTANARKACVASLRLISAI